MTDRMTSPNPMGDDAERIHKLAKQARLWTETHQAIIAYLLHNGVPEHRARGASSDSMDEPLTDILLVGGNS